MNGVVPPRIGRDNSDPGRLRVFLRLYEDYENDMRKMTGFGSGNAPIQMWYEIGRLYLDLGIMDKLQNRPSGDTSHNNC